MKILSWSPEKNLWLQEVRGVSFEEVAFLIENDAVIEVKRHPNQEKYPHQKIFVLDLADYVYLVPFVEDDVSIFLKTIIPSRKAKKEVER